MLDVDARSEGVAEASTLLVGSVLVVVALPASPLRCGGVRRVVLFIGA